MTDLLLTDREQAAVRAIVAAEPVPGPEIPGASVLPHVVRLIPCDAAGVALLDVAEPVADDPSRAGARESGQSPWAARPRLGIQQLDRDGGASGPSGGRGVAALSLGVSCGSAHVAKLWLVRRTGAFTAHDRSMLALVAPALARLMRERPAPPLPPVLTVQEHRVLRLVARGMSNAEVAERLGIAPCTVRKHLEHAYRKLGVTNRLAAVFALADRTLVGHESVGVLS